MEYWHYCGQQKRLDDESYLVCLVDGRILFYLKTHGRNDKRIVEIIANTDSKPIPPNLFDLETAPLYLDYVACAPTNDNALHAWVDICIEPYLKRYYTNLKMISSQLDNE